VFFTLTSSNFLHINRKPLLTLSNIPCSVTILSGVEPSVIVIRAPLFKNKINFLMNKIENEIGKFYLFTNLFNIFTFLIIKNKKKTW
jgi:hypothetical protein